MKEKTFMKKYGMLLMILGVAAVTRLAGLGKIPEGILPDEACAAFFAWALMTEGAANYNLNSYEVPLDKSSMINELKNGHPII